MEQLQRGGTTDSGRHRCLDLRCPSADISNLSPACTGLSPFRTNLSLGVDLGNSAGCLKLGPMKLSWGWWLMGFAPPMETFEVPTDRGHPDGCTGGILSHTAPWKALGSLGASLQVGMIPEAGVSRVLQEMTPVWSCCNRSRAPQTLRGGLSCVERSHPANNLAHSFLSSWKTCVFVGWPSAPSALRHRWGVTEHLCTAGDSLHLQKPPRSPRLRRVTWCGAQGLPPHGSVRPRSPVAAEEV